MSVGDKGLVASVLWSVMTRSRSGLIPVRLAASSPSEYWGQTQPRHELSPQHLSRNQRYASIDEQVNINTIPWLEPDPHSAF